MYSHRLLTIHSLPRLALNETVSYKGEPHTVVELHRSTAAKYRHTRIVKRPVLAVTLKPIDGGLSMQANEKGPDTLQAVPYKGKLLKVSLQKLVQRASLLDEAKRSVRDTLRGVRESYAFITIKG